MGNYDCSNCINSNDNSWHTTPRNCSDIAEEDTVKSGTNRDGMFFVARTFAFKMSQSLAMLIFTSFDASGQIGCRMAAITSTVLCIFANLALIRYDEKRILSICIEHEASLHNN